MKQSWIVGRELDSKKGIVLTGYVCFLEGGVLPMYTHTGLLSTRVSLIVRYYRPSPVLGHRNFEAHKLIEQVPSSIRPRSCDCNVGPLRPLFLCCVLIVALRLR